MASSRSGEAAWLRFVTGGAASCIAECATLPMDIAKVRLQVQGAAPAGMPRYSGMFDCIRGVIRFEGTAALYKGIQPALLRQASYSSLRMGFYEPIRNMLAPKGTSSKDLSFSRRALAGGTAGALGIAFANPTELIKIRMQADATGTRYPNGVVDALVTTARREGLRSLWRGVTPNAQRAYIVNAAELASYDQAKHVLARRVGFRPESPLTHLLSSVAAGAIAAACSQPVDLVKNRLMSQPSGPGVAPRYSGMLDCGVQIVRAEGPLALYKGVAPYACRVGTFCVVMFPAYEQLRELGRWAAARTDPGQTEVAAVE